MSRCQRFARKIHERTPKRFLEKKTNGTENELSNPLTNFTQCKNPLAYTDTITHFLETLLNMLGFCPKEQKLLEPNQNQAQKPLKVVS